MDQITVGVKLNFFDSIMVRANKNNMLDSDAVQSRERVCLLSSDDIINLIMADLKAENSMMSWSPTPVIKTHFYALLNSTYALLQCEYPHQSPPTFDKVRKDFVGVRLDKKN